MAPPAFGTLWEWVQLLGLALAAVIVPAVVWKFCVRFRRRE